MSKQITAIKRDVVHQICSGQVVLNLATAVKELIENSLDAGATTIEIVLKEYGSELIRVSDNGRGIHPDDFEALALKHHTSKIKDYSDLVGVETFGFRGEALSSLCAVSELIVMTRHESENCGSKLMFDRLGVLQEKQPFPRQVGTTVTLVNLFSSLPVRQKEFLRNLKKEFTKTSQLLSAYCLIATNVRITCVNQTKKSGRTTFLSTQENKTVRENISCVFGPKQLSNLLEIADEAASAESLREFGVSDTNLSTGCFNLKGFISSCEHGCGRSSSDRQFYYVNSRPCDPAKIMKLTNEVYHRYNQHQFPFVLLNLVVPKESVDVNVTPDKRLIFLENEKLLLARVQSSLVKTFERIPSTYRIHSPVSLLATSAVGRNENEIANADGVKSLLKLNKWRYGCNNYNGHDSTSVGQKRQIVEHPRRSSSHKQLKLDHLFKTNSDDRDNWTARVSATIITDSVSVLSRETGNLSATEEQSDDEEHAFTVTRRRSVVPVCDEPTAYYVETDDTTTRPLIVSKAEEEKDAANPSDEGAAFVLTDSSRDTVGTLIAVSKPDSTDKVESTFTSDVPTCSEDSGLAVEFEECDQQHGRQITAATNERILTAVAVAESNRATVKPIVYECTAPFQSHETRKIFATIETSVSSLRESLRVERERKNHAASIANRFHAEIDPTANQVAEEELRREISKHMFSKMKIVGQFNLGFIVAKLENDLFIVDQHAADEKYNFEILQRTTLLKNQKLVVPQNLNLTATNECILMDNVDVLKKNGFEFSIDTGAEPTKKVKLTSIPISHNWQFGKDDIDEMLFMLQDAPNTLCRPSRIKAMFASRACRKSVMIGTPLSVSDMRKLLNNMGTIEQPWNCPHGRPTMRHLVNLSLLH